MKVLSKIVIALLLCALLPLGRAITAQAEPETLLADLNAARDTANVPALRLNDALTEAAAMHSIDMAAHGLFQVESSDGSTLEDRLQAVGYSYQAVNQLILKGRSLTPESALDYWLNDEDARSVLLDPAYDELGIAWETAASREVYFTLLLAKGAVCEVGISEDADIQQTQADSILMLVNEVRQNYNMGTLTLNDQLTAAALRHTQDMAALDFVEHEGSDGSAPGERAEEAGYQAVGVAENILSRFDLSAEGAFQQWMDSPPHRAAILTPQFTEIGLAFTCSPETGKYYYAMELGEPVLPLEAEMEADAFLTLLNEARAAEALPALTLDSSLSEAAQSHSDDLAAMGIFQAEGSDGTTIQERLEQVGYSYRRVNQLLLKGKGLTGESALDYWLDDTDTQAELLSRQYSEIGIGMAQAESGEIVITLLLAHPR